MYLYLKHLPRLGNEKGHTVDGFMIIMTVVLHMNLYVEVL